MAYIWGLPAIRWSPYLKQLFSQTVLGHIEENSPVSRSTLQSFVSESRIRKQFPGCHRSMHWPHGGYSELHTRLDVALKFLEEKQTICRKRRGVAMMFFFVKNVHFMKPLTDNPRAEYLQELVEIYQADGRIRESVLTHMGAVIHSLEKRSPGLAEIALLELHALKDPEDHQSIPLEMRLWRKETTVEKELERLRGGNMKYPVKGDVAISVEGESTEAVLCKDGTVNLFVETEEGKHGILCSDPSDSFDAASKDLREGLLKIQADLRTRADNIDVLIKDAEKTARQAAKMAAIRESC